MFKNQIMESKIKDRSRGMTGSQYYGIVTQGNEHGYIHTNNYKYQDQTNAQAF